MRVVAYIVEVVSDGNLNNDVCDVDQVADVEPTDLGKASADVIGVNRERIQLSLVVRNLQT